jgi:CRP/FNR family cyclic AMP-dependent transcriptional regulator
VDDRSEHISNFQREVRDWFHSSQSGVVARRINRNRVIYSPGDNDGTVYFVEGGSVKTMMLSRSGKACLLNIHVAGTMFGELCLAGISTRQDTALTMRECRLKLSTRARFLAMLRTAGLMEGFAAHLAERIADQERRLADSMMLDAIHRLAAHLLQFAQKLGTKESSGTRISQKISHRELSEMIGTTRPRVSEFLQKFRTLNLVKVNLDGFLIVDEQALGSYLEQAP